MSHRAIVEYVSDRILDPIRDLLVVRDGACLNPEQARTLDSALWTMMRIACATMGFAWHDNLYDNLKKRGLEGYPAFLVRIGRLAPSDVPSSPNLTLVP